MPDGTVSVWLKVADQSLVHDLRQACERLDSADGEVVIDCSSVRRVGPGALDALAQLAEYADELGVRVVLRGVNVEIYKVLKLVKLAPHFAFVN